MWVFGWWMTYDRRAGLFTSYVNYWLDLAEGEDNLLFVGIGPFVNDFPQAVDSWQGSPDDLPAIAHQLTIAQHATFIDANGETVRVTAHPIERTVLFGQVCEQEEPEG